MFVSLLTGCVNSLLASLDVMEMNTTRTTHTQPHTHTHTHLCSRMRGHLIGASHQYNFNHCGSYLTLIQEWLIGNKRETQHLLSCFPWHEWHHQGWGYLPLCVCACVCGYQQVCLRKVTGWDRHCKEPFGPVLLISPTHILSFSHAIHLTHTQRHTHSQLNYMSRWSVEFICNLLRSALFSKSHDRSHIIFRPSLRTSITGLPLHYFCFPLPLSTSSPSSHVFIYVSESDERKVIALCLRTTQTGWCLEL